MDEENTQEQLNNSDKLKPWQFKKGQSGNPGGRPKGTKSLKEFSKEYLRDLSDNEKLEFLEGIDKKTVWEMGENKPRQDMDVETNVKMLIHIDE